MNITMILLFLLLFPGSLLAETFTERAARTYLETDKNYDLDCFYLRNKSYKLIVPKTKTMRDGKSLSRDFIVKTLDKEIPLSFSVLRTNKNFEYEVRFDQKHVASGTLPGREFFIAPIRDLKFAQEFETSQIYCEVNFAYAYPHTLVDGEYHFNVHPHQRYDWQDKLQGPTEKYLNDLKYSSIIFLETGNNRGNLVNINSFFDGIEQKLPQTEADLNLENVPDHVPLIVSPAGNNRFEFKVKKTLSITFTGGNHNYCIWNVTRHVLQSLLNSDSVAKITFLYDMNSIVAQPRGVEGMGLNFNRRDVNRSNLLKDLLQRTEVQTNYHPAYLNYFKNYLAEKYSGMYRSYKIIYKAPGFETTTIMKGSGQRDLEVSFIYF